MKRMLAVLLCAALCAALCVLTACKSDPAQGTSDPKESVPAGSGATEPENPEEGIFLPGRIEILGEGRAVMRAADVSFADDTLTLVVDGRVLCELKFDEAGNPVEEHVYPINGGELHTERVYADGLLMKKNVLDGGVPVYTEKYEYDANGKETAMTRTGHDPYRRERVYDENGNCIRETSNDMYGLRLQRVCTYDAQGRLIREEQDGAQADLRTYEYSYDEAGRLDRITRYEFHWVQGIGVHTYDGEGRLTDLTWIDSDGNAHYDRYTYEYDENGRLVVEMEYTLYDYPWHKYTYAYDGDGNRTERLTWVEWTGGEENSEREWSVSEGSKASGFFRANITEGEYREIQRFLSENGYPLP